MSSQWLAGLNQRLMGRTFLVSHTMGSEDSQALAKIAGSPELAELAGRHREFPHVFRWRRHCASLGTAACSSPAEPAACASSPEAAQVARQQQGVLDKLARVRALAEQCEAKLQQLGVGRAQSPTEWRAVLGPDGAELAAHCEAAGLRQISFHRVPGDYYERELEERRGLVGASSVDQLCKTIVLENLKWSPQEDSPANQRFVAVILQYTTRLNADAVKKVVADGACLPKAKFNFQLANGADSERITGYKHNAVVPIGMKTQMPIIISDKIAKLSPGHFFLGAGQVDVKLKVDLKEFMRVFTPSVARIVH